MLRLNKKDIVRAYRETGLVPVTGTFFERRDNKCCGCAISALALANGVVCHKDNYYKRINRTINWANKTFGEENVNNFVNGFDSGTCQYTRYGRTGRATRLALEKANLLG